MSLNVFGSLGSKRLNILVARIQPQLGGLPQFFKRGRVCSYHQLCAL